MVDPIHGRGVSSMEIRNWVVPYIVEKVKPRTVFDLGCGIGVYGAAIRTMDPMVRLLGLDGFLPYLLQDLPREHYVVRINAPIESVLDGEFTVHADLTICMDVIEHFEKPMALQVLDLPGRMIVSTPLFDYKQGPVAGNALEEHKCWFTEKELNEEGFKTLCLFNHVSADGQAGVMGAFEKTE
jgi:2-polyprenyl-3-methyl-5-hydroxy-6-metoxy-1,4-benzoquinol methylase